MKTNPTWDRICDADHLSFMAQRGLGRSSPDFDKQLDDILAAHERVCAALRGADTSKPKKRRKGKGK